MFSWWPWVLKESRRSSCHLWAVAGGPWGANTLPWWHLPSLGSCSKRNPRVPDGAKCSGCKASQGRRGGDQGRECLSRPEGGERAACTCRKSSRQRAQQGQKGPEVGARRYLRSSGGGRCDGSRAKEREQKKTRVGRQICLAPWAFVEPQAFLLGGAAATAGSGGEGSHRLSDLREGPLVALLRRDCVRRGQKLGEQVGPEADYFGNPDGSEGAYTGLHWVTRADR